MEKYIKFFWNLEVSGQDPDLHVGNNDQGGRFEANDKQRLCFIINFDEMHQCLSAICIIFCSSLCR